MSLDVYLEVDDDVPVSAGTGVFVRENGRLRELTTEEELIRFPVSEPVRVRRSEYSSKVYSGNITHNLNRMAEAAGIYKELWRPDEIGIVTAADLIEPLRRGLGVLRSDPVRFKAYNPENGWGDYDGLVSFVAEYVAACEQYPQATVRVWR